MGDFYMWPAERFYEELLYLPIQKIMGKFYMSEKCGHQDMWFSRSLCACGAMHHYCSDCGEQVEDCDPDGEEPLFDEWSLEVLCNMDNPPGEAYETSWRRADDLLKAAGARSAILLLTVGEDQDGNLESAVVLSSGYQRIPTNIILEILDTHLGSLIGEEGDGSAL